MVSTKLLFTKDGKAFLQAELEPVTQGHTVTRPVMQVLMTDHIPDGAIVMVGRGCRLCEDVAGVKDVESLVLHGAHVEVLNRHNVVLVKVVFTVIYLFIPEHRVTKCAQGKVTLRDIPRASVDSELDVAPGGRREPVFDKLQRTCNQSK